MIHPLERETPASSARPTSPPPAEWGTAVPQVDSGSAARPKVVAFYHRPVEDRYHGGSRHFEGFIQGLRERVPVRVVAPLPSRGWGTAGEDLSVIASLRNIYRAYVQQLRFVLDDARLPRGERSRVLLVFDIYGVPLPLLWAKIRSVDFVFSPQDITAQWLREFPAQGYRGGRLLGLIRGPLDRSALSASRLIVAVSDWMAGELERDGTPGSKLRVCTLKRPTSRPVAADIAGWRNRLDSAGRVLVVFVGSTRYPPAARSCEFILKELVPGFRDRQSRVRFVLVGAGTEAHREGAPPNVTALGRVEDLDGLLDACDIGLAPLDVTGGTSGKIVDYVIHGLRVLATPQAARGISSSPLISVSPLAGFAEALSGLVREVGSDAHPRPTDPRFLREYTEKDDLHRLGEELERLADRPDGRL